MTDGNAGRLEMTFDLDAPPEKVWRAIAIADYRERWLPQGDMASAEPVGVTEGSVVSYRLRDSAPPHTESLVTFFVADNGRGGTRLDIVQRTVASRHPANGNGETMMLAA